MAKIVNYAGTASLAFYILSGLGGYLSTYVIASPFLVHDALIHVQSVRIICCSCCAVLAKRQPHVINSFACFVCHDYNVVCVCVCFNVVVVMIRSCMRALCTCVCGLGCAVF